MKKLSKLTALGAALSVAILLNAPCGLAQEATPSPTATPAEPAPASEAATKPARGNSAERMEQFRTRMNEFMKTQLKVTDEEWAIIQPLLEKVQTKQRDAMVGRFGFFGGRRNGGNNGGGDRAGRPERPERPERPATPEIDALKAALEAENSSPAEIKTKLEAVRALRKKAVAELEQAREELRKVLTQRQEATLVMVGILE